MIKKHQALIFVYLIVIIFISNRSYAAFNFQGVQLALKSVPTSSWRYGIRGEKLVVIIPQNKTIDNKDSFMIGDIVISLDGNIVSSYNDLLNISPGIHVIKVFRKNTLVDIPISTEYIKQINKEKSISSEQSLPPVVVNDNILEKKFGKSESKSKSNKRTYQDCIDDEMANSNTYEYHLNNPNSGYSVTGNSHYGNLRSLDYDRAKKKCEFEFNNVIHVITH